MRCYYCEKQGSQVEFKMSFYGDQYNGVTIRLCDECIDKIDIVEVWDLIKEHILSKVKTSKYD